jgi:uncharacterized protein YoxC
MDKLVLLAALVALIALTVAVIRLCALIKRLHRLVDCEVSATVRDMGETVQGIRRTVGKLDDGLDSLNSTLARVDRMTATVAPESLARSVAQPALRKVASWLGGLRRGLAAQSGRTGAAGAAGAEDSEAG